MLTCTIQWIDCKGRPTPDTNPAVGFAVYEVLGVKHRFAICTEHKASIGKVHHDPTCTHRGTMPSGFWYFEPLTEGTS